MKLYRAVSELELADLRTSGTFGDSIHQSGEKGFFFAYEDAASLALSLSRFDGLVYKVIETECPDKVLARGRPHEAAQEGPGVYLSATEWSFLTRAVEVKGD